MLDQTPKHPEYLAVNVYMAKSGWCVVSRVMRSGGAFPRTVRDLGTIRLPAESVGLHDAARAAAEALLAYADRGD
jgi:hypothetical protein